MRYKFHLLKTQSLQTSVPPKIGNVLTKGMLILNISSKCHYFNGYASSVV